MAQQIINIGATVNDGTGDTLRSGAQKINANFAELYLTTLPSQTGNSGKFLTTDGTGTQWQVISDTIIAAADNLTGTTLKSTVVNSSLTSVGTLIDLAVTNPILGNITGNAATVTNGVYTNQSYANPTWIASLSGTKVTGNIAGKSTGIVGTLNSQADQDIGVYRSERYANPEWITGLSAAKVLPSPIGQAGKFLTTTGSVEDSGYSWGTITSLPGGGLNRIVYQTGVGNTGFLPAPTSGDTYLKFDGTNFEWTATGTGQGTVSSVSATGTVSGLTLSTGVNPITSTGTVTLGGTLTLTSGNVTGALGYTPLKLTDLSITTLAATGPGAISYNSSTGVFTFTPPAPPVGTVNDFIFADGNGFDGTVTLATSTPTLSLAMTVTGLLKGSGTGFTTAQAGVDYLAPYTSTTANLVFASPNATSGVPTFRQLVATDIPTLNQNTTGSAARLTAARNINGQPFDGTADISVTVPLSTGVTGISSNVISFLTTPTSTTLATILTDETGSGSVVFNSAPTISNPIISNPTITTSLATSSTAFDLLASVATTINFAGETTSLTIGNSGTVASTTNIVTGAITTGLTKTVNLATGGLAGSSTVINIGSVLSTTSIIANGTIGVGGLITANAGVSSTSVSASNGVTITGGDLTLQGTNRKVIGDFSNSTLANRTVFVTGTADASTGIYAVPNGSSTGASWQAINNSAPTNASKILIATNGTTDVQLVSGINGSGTYLPMTFWSNGAGQVRLDTSGNFTVYGAGGIGYGTGSGGTVTQGTSRVTGVTLDKTNGAITLFSATTTAATFTSFTVTNSTVAASDSVIVNMKSGTADSYIITVSAVATGSFRVQIYNVAAVAVAEAPVITFAVIKAVTA